MKYGILKRFTAAILILLLLTASLFSCTPNDFNSNQPFDLHLPDVTVVTVPAFTDSPYYVINDNQPYFTEDEITDVSYEYYSPLDSLKRCGIAISCIGIDLMPTEDRESISSVKPTGWQSVKYDSVDGNYLYNRCHLIGFQLTGENANENNLITGTRYMNVEGMLPFEKMVAAYIKETENHVMYRVTPIFEGNDLVAHGVLMEAYSVEDDGDGICFCVYVYNNQPGILIDYSNGDSKLDDGTEFPDNSSDNNEADSEENNGSSNSDEYYVLNVKTKKFHKPYHYSPDSKNAEISYKTREELIEENYSPCGVCKP